MKGSDLYLVYCFYLDSDDCLDSLSDLYSSVSSLYSFSFSLLLNGLLDL